MITVGERLRARRQAAGMTQRDAAKATNVSLRQIEYMELSGRLPTDLEAQEFARVYGCTAADLMNANPRSPRTSLIDTGFRLLPYRG